MIEELLIPERSVSMEIPRDYKVLLFRRENRACARGASKNRRLQEQNEHHYLTPNFVLMKEGHETSRSKSDIA